MATLHVRVYAEIDGDIRAEHDLSVPVSPDYTPADTDALIVRKIEDTAFELTRSVFGRQPTKKALLATTARIRAIETYAGNASSLAVLKDRIEDVLALTNDEAIAQWGEPDSD